ncbi:V-type H+-transporting ATPase subunit E [Pancytospora philotis]|nr:V-type H+-transporting ATPase subunit E [Pancytospora philotis]
MPSADLHRMTMSIEQEVRSRLKELRVQTVHMYNEAKAQHIESQTAALELETAARIKKMQEHRRRSEEVMRHAYKLRYQRLRHKKLEEVLGRAAEKLVGVPLAESLIADTLKCVGTQDLTNFYIYVLEQDRAAVLAYLAKMKIGEAMERNIRELPPQGLGGIFIAAADGKEMYDSTYATRLEIFREKHLREIAQWMSIDTPALHDLCQTSEAS